MGFEAQWRSHVYDSFNQFSFFQTGSRSVAAFEFVATETVAALQGRDEVTEVWGQLRANHCSASNGSVCSYCRPLFQHSGDFGVMETQAS